MNFQLHRNKEGFTLIELLISMVIVAFISLALFQATSNSFNIRETLSVESDFNNEIRLSMSILEKDISLIYTPSIMAPTPENKNQNQNTNQPQTNITAQPTTVLPEAVVTRFWGDYVDATGLRHTRFLGEESEMSFISASHIRVYKESRESVFSKIVYKLENDDSEIDLSADNEKAFVLTKVEDVDVFNTKDELHDDAKKYPLLFGVKSLKFRYYRKDKAEWSSSWDSDHRDSKNLFPDLIEVKIEVTGEKNQLFEGVFKFRTEVPLAGIYPST